MLNKHKVCKTPDCGTIGTKAFGLCPRCYKNLARAEGLCNWCVSKPKVAGTGTCAECAPKQKQAMRDFDKRREDAARVAGLCVQHGCKNRATNGIRLCEHHQEKKKNQRLMRDLHAEYATVTGHYHNIRRGRSTYEGMPLFDEWNPAKGGSYWTGVKWIVDHIGRRPEKCDLHIVDRLLGFVPGNLQWVPRDQHRRQEMIYKLMLEIQTLKTHYELS